MVRSTIRLPGGFDTAARFAHELAQPTSPSQSWLSRSASASEQIESKPKRPRSGTCTPACHSAARWFRHSRSLRSRAGSTNFGFGDPHPGSISPGWGRTCYLPACECRQKIVSSLDERSSLGPGPTLNLFLYRPCLSDATELLTPQESYRTATSRVGRPFSCVVLPKSSFQAFRTSDVVGAVCAFENVNPSHGHHSGREE